MCTAEFKDIQRCDLDQYYQVISQHNENSPMVRERVLDDDHVTLILNHASEALIAALRLVEADIVRKYNEQIREAMRKAS